MNILGIESTATAASAAVLIDEKLVSLSFSNTGLTHSQTLMPMISEALNRAGLDANSIDLIAVANGPGSFTGVRIGVSAAKGIASARGIPCLGVSSLEAIAKPLSSGEAYIVSAMDARCKQVYSASFSSHGGILNRLTPDRAIAIEELTSELKAVNEPIVLTGDGGKLCYDYMKDILPGVILANAGIRYQSAASVAIIAGEMLCENPDCSLDAGELLPVYLRPSQAERELKKKNSK